jgi:L-fuculose-phosphate aldolase
MSEGRAAIASQVRDAARALHARGWVANHDGNVSARIGDRFLVTPTAISKAATSEAGLAVVDLAGKTQEGDGKAPSEFALHGAAYRVRDDVRAVVHAHPPHATAVACLGVALPVFLAEAVVSIGVEVPITTFALPYGDEGASPVAALIDRHDALLLCRHGVLTVGADIEQAMLRMELVEHLARIWLLAKPLGGVRALPGDAIPKLLERRANAGLGAAAAKATPAIGEETAAPTTDRGAPAWSPAGPPPARDAWSGGAVDATCGVVYGAGERPVVRPALADAIREEIVKTLKR